MECSEADQYLISHHDGVVLDLPSDVREHLETCPRCRLEFEQNRNLAADLQQLAEIDIESPVWLLGALTETTVDHLRRRAALRASSKQLARPGVLAGGALVIAGVAGALIVRGRARRHRAVTQHARAAA